MWKCAICGYELQKKLPQHLEREHNLSRQDYYDKYVRTDPRDGLCKFCGGPTNFIDIKHGLGYRDFCSKSCRFSYTHKMIQEDPTRREEWAKHSRELFVDAWKDPETRAKWAEERRDFQVATGGVEAHVKKIKETDPEHYKEILRIKSENAGSYRGFHHSPKAGDIFYQSNWELNAYKLLDVDDTVAMYERGPVIQYRWAESDQNYVADILVTYIDGSKRIVEVKADDFKFDPQNKVKYKAACLYSKKQGYLPFKVWDSKYVSIDQPKRRRLSYPWNSSTQP